VKRMAFEKAIAVDEAGAAPMIDELRKKVCPPFKSSFPAHGRHQLLSDTPRPHACHVWLITVPWREKAQSQSFQNFVSCFAFHLFAVTDSHCLLTSVPRLAG